MSSNFTKTDLLTLIRSVDKNYDNELFIRENMPRLKGTKKVLKVDKKKEVKKTY